MTASSKAHIDINTMARNLRTPRSGDSPAMAAMAITRYTRPKDTGGYHGLALAAFCLGVLVGLVVH